MKDRSRLEELLARSSKGPLSGIVIADFGRVLAGPYCTMLLADMGATVIKVESPAGDETRAWMPPEHEGQSTYYLSINRNKLSIKLDFSDPEDLAVARDLAGRADVVIENFKPGGLEKFGLDYQSVTSINPTVIFASITGFGTAGGAGLPGYDLLVQAASGLMSLTGAPDTEPFRAGVAVVDVFTGMHACIGILAALNHRQATGEGQRVEVNLLSSALSGLVNQTGAYAIAGVVPTRMGNEHPSIYPYEPIATGEGEIVLAIGNDRQFRGLCRELGIPELAEDPRFAAAPDRSRNRLELRPLLELALAQAAASEWFERLTAAGIPCAPIQDIAAGVQFAERIGLDPIIHAGPEAESLPGIRHPIAFSRTPATYDKAPPGLGADTELVRRWLAGPLAPTLTAAKEATA
ncbi:CaiB/BaiF CoA transferase family protein [Microbacterium profundi]|nr:CoA transferase [Alphaproteobacteria bacterium]